MTSAKKFFIVAGQSDNFRRTLPDAVEAAQNNGFDLRIIDVSALNEHWRRFPNDWAAVGLQSIMEKVGTRADLQSLLRNNLDPGSLVLFLFLPDRQTRSIWRIFKGHGAMVGTITPGPLPKAGRDDSVRARGSLRKLRGAAARLKQQLTRRVKPELDFWIVSGEQCLTNYAPYFRDVSKARLIWAHSLEYDRYLEEGGKASASGGDGSSHIAFLEQGWFSKPPPVYLSPEVFPPVSYSEYVDQLAPLFRKIESITGRKVIICAHPKSNRQHTREMFRGFEFSFDSSNKVVAGASGVIAMSSTSIQYAVIHRKPLLMVTTPTLSRSFIQDFIDGYSDELDAPGLQAGDDHALQRIMQDWRINEPRYEAFMRRFIKPRPGDRRRMWEIVFAEFANGS